jgi:hypothetical protein
MDKIYKSVGLSAAQCIEPTCITIPTAVTELNGPKNVLGQIVSCPIHTEIGKRMLEEKYPQAVKSRGEVGQLNPKYFFVETTNPPWLFKAHKQALEQGLCEGIRVDRMVYKRLSDFYNYHPPVSKEGI